MLKRKEKDNDLPKTMQKTNDPTTRTPIKTGVNPGAPIGLADPDPIVTPVMLPLNDTKSSDMEIVLGTSNLNPLSEIEIRIVTDRLIWNQDNLSV